MEITNVACISPGYVGVWKTGKHCGIVHAYGYSDITNYFKTQEDAMTQFNSGKIDQDILNTLMHRVADDLSKKIGLMMDEDSNLPQEGLYNYGRFFNRYVVDCNVSIFSDAKCICRLPERFFQNYDKIHRFFGAGEFPFVDVYFIAKEDHRLEMCYILVH